jgi:beta-glucosidase-like glycosyl hydrolase
MGFRSQTGTRRSGKTFQRSRHEKAKHKTHKHRDKDKFLQEEHTVTAEGVTEKTLSSLKRLGNQKFAVSPFSLYFDDWLLNVKEALSEFESSQAVKADEAFVNDRQSILAKVEREFDELKEAEAVLNVAVKELADTNHLLMEIDAEYAAKTREIGPKGNAEIRSLTLNVKNLEEELERVKQMKTSLFSFTKKAKRQKEAETLDKLESAKAELKSALQSFKVEQEKLHDEYEKKKHITIEYVQRLEKEVEKLEHDNSVTARHDACEALVEAMNALLDRQPESSSEPTS